MPILISLCDFAQFLSPHSQASRRLICGESIRWNVYFHRNRRLTIFSVFRFQRSIKFDKKSGIWNVCVMTKCCIYIHIGHLCVCVVVIMNAWSLCVKLTVVFGKVSCLLCTFFINYLLCLECDKIIYYFDEMCRCNFYHVFVVYTAHTHTAWRSLKSCTYRMGDF